MKYTHSAIIEMINAASDLGVRRLEVTDSGVVVEFGGLTAEPSAGIVSATPEPDGAREDEEESARPDEADEYADELDTAHLG